MAPRARLSLPTNAALSHSHRLSPSNTDVTKALSRLSRSTLISLVLEWLSDSDLQHCLPYTLAEESEDDTGEEDAPYLAAQSVEELREIYEELQGRRGSKREIVDRIVEGDWRRGISLYQMAMAETRYIMEHQASQKWHALRLSKVRDEGIQDSTQKDEEEELPRFRQQTFLQNLQREIGPFAKAHYYFTRKEELRISLLRIQLYDIPYNTPRALQNIVLTKRGPSEGAKTLYFVFPDATAYVYVSLPSSAGMQPGAEGRSLQRIVIDVRNLLENCGIVLMQFRLSPRLCRGRKRDAGSSRQTCPQSHCRHFWRFEDLAEATSLPEGGASSLRIATARTRSTT